ncbi:MAG: hypothetical protein QM627_12520 [Luteolibacter sp.]
MDPLNPWLDPVETRRLAERLMMPLREPTVSVQDPGFDSVFVGFEAMRAAPDSPPPATAENPSSPLPSTVVPAAVVASPSPTENDEPPPLPAHMAAAPPAPSATSARGPFLDRIHRLCEWLREHFSASDIFILDRDGAVIFDESHHGRLHFIARNLALASRRPGASADNVHVKIGADATLEVIPVDTPFGWLVLGTIVPNALTTRSVTAIKNAMLQVASPRSGDRQ